MTSPAFVVLMLALVCSTYGAAMEQTADQSSEHAMHINTNSIDHYSKMRTWTNNNNYIVNNHIINNNKHKESNKINNIYTQNDVSDKKFEINENAIEFRVKDKELNIFNKSPILLTEYLNFYKRNDVILQSNHYLKHTKVDNRKSYESKVVPPYNKRRDLKSNIKTVHKITNDTMSPWKHLSRVKREDAAPEQDSRCEDFVLTPTMKITPPHDKTYFSNIECERVIQAKEGEVIKLTFIDVFHIEEHPKCTYDYLEVRDGPYGFSKSMGRYCGEKFPQTLISSGPYMWLKFRADETIEYEGFTISVEFIPTQSSYSIPKECYKELKGKPSEEVIWQYDNKDVTDGFSECIEKSTRGNHGVDILWNITTKENTYINLDFTLFELAKPNECEENVVEVFGYHIDEEKILSRYCGSAANALSSRLEGKTPTGKGNTMFIHLYMSQYSYQGTKIKAVYTEFRALDPNKDEKCEPEPEEFNCDDNTCISFTLRCNEYPNCRLKADEDVELCKKVTTSLLAQTHILVILVIFCLILSAMSIVFFFKCIKKLYEDHKAIKEHIRQSTEDRLDTLMSGSRLILDPKTLHEPRASLERENHTNELFKQQRSVSQHKRIPQQTSIDSDFQETRLDLDDDPWHHRDAERITEPQDIQVERNGKTRRSDTSKKEESLRSRKESVEEKKEIRDAAVGAPDTKESGCQTRESLFQVDNILSSDGSNSASNSRGFSTFGYSGATLVRPSPPPAAPPAPMISSTQIELLRQLPSLDSERSHKSQKKIPDRRPMSAETTRSAPDVIIVSKPIR